MATIVVKTGWDFFGVEGGILSVHLVPTLSEKHIAIFSLL
jgi:hypothetical protein